jgi:peptidoglycan/xylan/chitin deacetylase (PgdA/CDA1 family)
VHDIPSVENRLIMGWTRRAWQRFLASFLLSSFAIGAPAMASECNGKADALGVSRVIAVDPLEHNRVGTMQYPETLPLADHEVVLTFDDGPSPRYTDRILAALANECVKATFFMVGEMAKTFPEEARKVRAEGHTVGTHSFQHPFTFGRMSEAKADAEIDRGIQAVAAALGSSNEMAPFFRVPGLLNFQVDGSGERIAQANDMERGFFRGRLEGDKQRRDRKASNLQD